MIEDTGDSITQATTNLGLVMERLQTAQSLEAFIRRIEQEIADQKLAENDLRSTLKDHVGQRPEDMDKETKDTLGQQATYQEKLAERTDQLQRDMDTTSGQLQKSDASSAQVLKRAADMTQSLGISQSQSNAAGEARQNLGSQAQRSQQLAVSGLEKVLGVLKQGQNEILKKLVHKLDELDKCVQLLIQRQASHNCENLTLQNKPIDDELKKDAGTLILTVGAKSEIGSMSASQEQTEHNTRDVITRAGDLPDSTEIVSMLTRAAEKMVDAITTLRDEKLPQPERLAGAYDPHQVGALASLKEALKLIAKQKQKAKDDADDAKKEDIRQALMEVQEGQRTKINGTTTRAANVPSLPDGRLEALITHLPDEQQKLIDALKKIGEDLQTLGAVEFTSANDEVMSTMGTVKDLLTRLQVGKATQAEEQAIDDELTAMIDALKKAPDDKDRYEEPDKPGSGGSGSGGKPRMPSEQELRLMKNIQLIINHLTAIADGNQDRNKDVTRDLSRRQFRLRNNLDQIIKALGAPGIGPEPDPEAIKNLPEVNGTDKVDDVELTEILLKNKNPKDDLTQKIFALVGVRMWASGHLLQEDRPGQTTQTIQKRIIANLDKLIEMAHKDQKKGRGSKPQPGKPGEQPTGDQAPSAGGGPGQPKPNGTSPANQDVASSASENDAQLKEMLPALARTMFPTTPRNVPETIELRDERVLEKFANLVRDYYIMMAKDTSTSPHQR